MLHEIEAGWWILASLDLTRLPTSRTAGSEDASAHHGVEYSSREVSPPQLILQHLLRAHSIFLLHHATSLADLYSRLPRTSFCTLLDRFWTRFIWDWDVLLHGNPAVDIYNGTKLAGGGEIGVGVGEEEWGSGEREVLEDFIARTEGLADLVVSRFGDAPERSSATAHDSQKQSLPARQEQAWWLGQDIDPRPSDGVLFSGIGAISKRSLASLSQWMADIYRYGGHAYGVDENPSARARVKAGRLSPRMRQSTASSKTQRSVREKLGSPNRGRSPVASLSIRNTETPAQRIPPPLVKVVEQSLDSPTTKASPRQASRSQSISKEQRQYEDEKQDIPLFGTEAMMKYLSLGYGSSWTLNPKGFSRTESKSASDRTAGSQLQGQCKDEGSGPDVSHAHEPHEAQTPEPKAEVNDNMNSRFVQHLEQSIGRFLIGLSGDLENQDPVEDDTENGPRIVLRTLTVEMRQPAISSKHNDSTTSDISGVIRTPRSPDTSSQDDSSGLGFKQFQVVVYVHQPFIFAFLFHLHTPSLIYPSFYRSIHHQLGPLQKPLLRSTDPRNVAARISNAMGESTITTVASPGKPSSKAAGAAAPIYDLIYDPEKITVHASLPNIPVPGSLAAEGVTIPTVSGSWYTLGIPTSTTSRTRSESRSKSHTRTSSTKSAYRSEWTRVDALNVHSQILNTHAATRRPAAAPQPIGEGSEFERTVKTGRGWWVLWMSVQGKKTPLQRVRPEMKRPDARASLGKRFWSERPEKPTETLREASSPLLPPEGPDNPAVAV